MLGDVDDIQDRYDDLSLAIAKIAVILSKAVTAGQLGDNVAGINAAIFSLEQSSQADIDAVKIAMDYLNNTCFERLTTLEEEINSGGV